MSNVVRNGVLVVFAGIAGIAGSVLDIRSIFVDGETRDAVIATRLEKLESDNDKGNRNATAIEKLRTEITSVRQSTGKTDTSAISAEIATLRRDVAGLRVQIQNGAGGAQVDLSPITRRVAALEAKPATGGDTFALQRRIADLETKLAKVGEEGGGIAPSFSFKNPKARKQIGDFSFTLASCRGNSSARCEFLVSYNGEGTKQLRLLAVNGTKAFLPTGLNVRPDLIVIGKTSRTKYIDHEFFSKTPVKVGLDFTKLPTSIAGFRLLRFETQEGILEFNDVPITAN